MSTTQIPILLLKSPSQPPTPDPYTTLFLNPPSTSHSPQPQRHPHSYNPLHIPILTHTCDTTPLLPLLRAPSFPYGGLIFTSQRAVSTFSLALSQLSEPLAKGLRIPIYAVGPATTKAVKAVCARYLPACEGGVVGEEAGTGEALAGIILDHYNQYYQTQVRSHGHCDGDAEVRKEGNGEGKKKPLLFLTGEKHRDIIPLTLQSPTLLPAQRIEVVEMVVYSTAAMQGFESTFKTVLRDTEEAGMRWIVVFSAVGGEAMLRALGWLDEETGRIKHGWGNGGGGEDGDEDGNEVKRRRRTFVASIGPTTRDYLGREYGLEVDVCAEKPSAEGVWEGIERFVRDRGNHISDGSG